MYELSNTTVKYAASILRVKLRLYT